MAGLVTACAATVKLLLKERRKGREDEQGDVISFRMTLRKREDTGT